MSASRKVQATKDYRMFGTSAGLKAAATMAMRERNATEKARIQKQSKARVLATA